MFSCLVTPCILSAYTKALDINRQRNYPSRFVSKMKAAYFAETSVYSDRTTHCGSPDAHTLN
jgi:hypothetical protein